MGRFLGDLIVREIDDGHWKLFYNLSYRCDLLKTTITVPAGFVTDFASIPRIPLAYWLLGGTANEAAVIHDFLYRKQFTTRKQADQVLLEAMVATDIIPWRRAMIYFGVRIGGWYVWMNGPKRCLALGS